MGGVMAQDNERRRARSSRTPISILLSLIVLLVGAASVVEAQDILYVKAGPGVGGSGSSWADAYTNLQDALTVAAAGGGSYEIWVAKGTYTPSVPADRDATFQLIEDVALYGGFAGTESKRGDRDWTAHETILSGDIGIPNDNTDNCHTVVTGCDHAVLDGFTITRGNADVELDGANFAPTFGGGMANLGTSPTVRHCHFLDNAAESGGGMVNFGGSPEVTGCAFEGNTAAWYGGGMWNRMSSPTVTGCTFSENLAEEEGGGMCNETGSDPRVTDCTFSDNGAPRGGGMCNYGGSSPTVTDCAFRTNFALFGGGMHNYQGSSPTATDCEFSENSALLGGGMDNYWISSPEVTGCEFNGNWALCGGGMSNDAESDPTVDDCVFDANVAEQGFRSRFDNSIGTRDRDRVAPRSHAEAAAARETGDGAGMFTYQSSPTVTNCTFSGNISDGHGGGMCDFGGSPTATDCTFHGNSAGLSGGGMYHRESSSTVTGCTFSGNEAVEYGGGMGNYESSLTVTDCTFSDNFAQYYGGGMDDDNSTTTVTDCTFSGNVTDGYGGGLSNYENASTVVRCAFSGNDAEAGGGMWNEYSSPEVSDCTFSANDASYGGGMCNGFDSSPEVVQCTFFGNRAAVSGGGIYGLESGGPVLAPLPSFGERTVEEDGRRAPPGTLGATVKNTILADNVPDDCFGYFASAGYNLESGTSCGCTLSTDQQNTDSLLDPDLQDNGGPTLTHELLPGSPAIDVIPWPGAPATDQRGLPRPYPAGGLADIGAVEMQVAYANGDVNGDGAIDLLDVVLCQQIARGRVTGTAQQREAADVDDDGDVDVDDVTILSEYVLGTRATLP